MDGKLPKTTLKTPIPKTKPPKTVSYDNELRIVAVLIAFTPRKKLRDAYVDARKWVGFDENRLRALELAGERSDNLPWCLSLAEEILSIVKARTPD